MESENERGASLCRSRQRGQAAKQQNDGKQRLTPSFMEFLAECSSDKRRESLDCRAAAAIAAPDGPAVRPADAAQLAGLSVIRPGVINNCAPALPTRVTIIECHGEDCPNCR